MRGAAYFDTYQDLVAETTSALYPMPIGDSLINDLLLSVCFLLFCVFLGYRRRQTVPLILEGNAHRVFPPAMPVLSQIPFLLHHPRDGHPTLGKFLLIFEVFEAQYRV